MSTTVAARPPEDDGDDLYYDLPGGNLRVSRVITGLWQVADAERGDGGGSDGGEGSGANKLNAESAADVMEAFLEQGLNTFDMADHYGSAEEITGVLVRRRGGDDGGVVVLTKWCPAPGDMSEAVVRAAVQRALDRLGVRRIHLLQFHWWRYEDARYLDALLALRTLRDEGMILHLGLTNFDTPHLRVVLTTGIPIITNQVCMSLLDRRACGAMTCLCLEHGVRLLAYGTLAGGLLTDRMRGKPEPPSPAEAAAEWSLAKYSRFLAAAKATWTDLQMMPIALTITEPLHFVHDLYYYQGLLDLLHRIAAKHHHHHHHHHGNDGAPPSNASVANVAARYVLQQPAVAAVIVGSHLQHTRHIQDNRRVLKMRLDEEDMSAIDAYLSSSWQQPIPGDCGDEYRRPPYLTASGDLSHHLAGLGPPSSSSLYTTIQCPWGSVQVKSGTVWEGLAGYSRAIRRGNRIAVSGTTATHGNVVVSAGDAEAQATFILDKIMAAIQALGGRLEDVIRTRIFVADVAEWEGVCRAHGRVFEAVAPANTLVQAALVGGRQYRVEIEAEAEVLAPDHR